MKEKKKLGHSLGFQLGIWTAIILASVEIGVYFLTVQSRRDDFKKLDIELSAKLSREYNLPITKVMGDHYIDMRMSEFKKNVIMSVAFIIAILFMGTFATYYILVGRFLQRLDEVNRSGRTGEVPLLFPEEKFPQNELGEIARQRNKMIGDMNEAHKKRSIEKSIRDLARVSNKLSHEILNPLSIIVGTSEMIADSLNDEKYLNEEINNDLKNIHESADRIDQIIKKFDQFSSVNFEEEVLDVNIVAILKKEIDEFKNYGHGNICYCIEDENIERRIRPFQFRFLVRLMLENSLKGQGPNGDLRINVDLRNLENVIQLIFSDNGSQNLESVRRQLDSG